MMIFHLGSRSRLLLILLLLPFIFVAYNSNVFTQIHDNTTCRPPLRQQLVYSPFVPTAHAVEELVQGPGLVNLDKAVCRIPIEDDDDSVHLISQLYRCFAYWNQLPEASEHILVLPQRKVHIQQSYVDGLIQSFQDVFGLRVEYSMQHDWEKYVVTPISSDQFSLRQSRDAIILRHNTVVHYKVRPQSGCHHAGGQPNIAIASHALRNAEVLAESLRERLGYQVEVFGRLENDFSLQLRAVSNTDIWIGSDGLVSIPFLPLCGAVVELRNSRDDRSYSSLAAAANVQHVSILYNATDCVNEDLLLRCITQIMTQRQECCKLTTKIP